MKQLWIMSGIALLLIFAPASCKKDSSASDYLNQADCSGITVSDNTYTKSIKAILDNNCAISGCHDAVRQEAGINLSTYAAAKIAFQNKECLCSIHHGSDCEPMPQGRSKLDDSTIKMIDCWGKNGYAE